MTSEMDVETGLITLEQADAVMREVVTTALTYVAEQLERAMAGEMEVADVLESVRLLSQG